MNLYAALDRRLRSEDLTQALAVLLLFLSLTLLFSWTGNPLTKNDSWFNLTAVGRVGLGVLAIYLALRSSRKPAVEQLASFLALLCVSLVILPFELVTFAASYPAASLVLSGAFNMLFPLGMFSIALLGTRLLPRAPWVTLLFTPLLLSAFVLVEELLGFVVLNPVNILTDDAWPLLVTWGLLSAAGLVVMVARKGRP